MKNSRCFSLSAAAIAVLVVLPLFFSPARAQVAGGACSPNGATASPTAAGTIVQCTAGIWTTVSSGMPSGAVMAFDLTACPSGWAEYTAARGRFIRGVCLDATGCQDSDGVRTVGSTQEDAFKSHTHSFVGGTTVYFHTPSGGTHSWPGGGGGITWGTDTQAAGGAETRAKNVALLYCRKD